MTEISLTDLADETGYSANHLNQLIKRGILPQGRKDGRKRMIPRLKAYFILQNHMPHKVWHKLIREKTTKVRLQDLI